MSGGVFVIAEAGVNHNGSLELALQLLDAAAAAGADAVKFQSFKAELLVSREAPKAQYQLNGSGAGESQFEMLKKLELNQEWHRTLLRRCQEKGIQFLSTPFDPESLDFLAVSLALPVLKISSGEITNAPLLLQAAQTGRSLLLSTGMSTLAEVEEALGVLAFGYANTEGAPSCRAFRDAYCADQGQEALREKVTLLHCTTEYPAPFREVNLRAVDTLRAAFGLPVGFSDHTPGIAVAIAAVARGAAVIEKHFTLDRTLPGPDHQASLEPEQLKEMITAIRQVESALGSAIKAPTASEAKNLPVARKSLVAAGIIGKGEKFSADNLSAKRPGTGISPMRYWEWIGKDAQRDYARDEQVT